jgi:hypothetical protein
MIGWMETEQCDLKNGAGFMNTWDIFQVRRPHESARTCSDIRQFRVAHRA